MRTQPALSLTGLTRSFRGKRAVDGVDLKVERGEIMGFLGPNGAGKTTVMNMVMGLLRPDRGEIELLGALGGARSREVRLKVGYLQERPSIYPEMSARAYLEFFADLYGVPNPAKRVSNVIDRVGLSSSAQRALGTYSRGMQQRACLARAMLHEPEFLLLDEPTLGLDPNGVVETRDILRDMRSQGATLFFSSHQLAEMEKVCDRVAFMKDGRLIASGAPADLLPSMDGDRVLQVEIHEDAGPTLDAVRDLEAVAEADQIGAHHIRVRLKSGGEDAREARATLSRDFAHLGLTVLSVAATTPTLEDLFLAFAAPSPTKH